MWVQELLGCKMRNNLEFKITFAIKNPLKYEYENLQRVSDAVNALIKSEFEEMDIEGYEFNASVTTEVDFISEMAAWTKHYGVY